MPPQARLTDPGAKSHCLHYRRRRGYEWLNRGVKKEFRVNVGGRSAEAMARLLHSGRNGRATLLGLLFVAVSLGAGYLTEEHQLAIRTFYSPVVIHFTSVFLLVCSRVISIASG